MRKKKERRREAEVRRADERTLEELVPKRFWKWGKVFGKAESERMPIRKP